jgi:DNA-binding transcriptional MerR regulator
MGTVIPSPAVTVRIGQLSSQTGCSVPTIRYYEQVGLIPRAVRSSARQRLYGTGSVQLLQFIRRCRDFGFTIGQIRALVSLTDKADRDCIEVRDIAKAHLVTVREKLGELKNLELTLCRFIAVCNSTCAGSPAPECSIFKELTTEIAQVPAASACCAPGKSVSSARAK